MTALEGWYSAQSTLLNLIGVNVLLTLSMYIGLSCGVLSLANAAFMGIGAYTVALLTPDANWPLWAALPAGALAATIVAVPLGLPVLRLRGVFLAVVTLGFGEVFSTVALTMLPARGALDPAAAAGRTTWWQIGLAVLAFCYLLWHIERSRLGHAFAVIRQDELLAGSLGINVAAHKLAAFVLGAFIAGLAGGLAVHLPQRVVPADFGVFRAETILFAAVVGGTGAFWGALPGAVLVTLLPGRLGVFADLQAGYGLGAFDLNKILVGAIALLTIVRVPGGISGTLRRWWRQRRNGGRPDNGDLAGGEPSGVPPLSLSPEEG